MYVVASISVFPRRSTSDCKFIRIFPGVGASPQDQQARIELNDIFISIHNERVISTKQTKTVLCLQSEQGYYLQELNSKNQTTRDKDPHCLSLTNCGSKLRHKITLCVSLEARGAYLALNHTARNQNGRFSQPLSTIPCERVEYASTYRWHVLSNGRSALWLSTETEKRANHVHQSTTWNPGGALFEDKVPWHLYERGSCYENKFTRIQSPGVVQEQAC